MCNTKLIDELRTSQVVISRAIRTCLSTKRRQEGKTKARITIKHTGLYKPYKLIGSFTEKPWDDELMFMYSIAQNEYFLQVWLSPGDMFLLKHKNDTFLHPEFPTTRDETGREVNITFSETMAYDQLREFLGVCFTEPICFKKYYLNASHFMVAKKGKPCEDRCFVSEKSFGIADGVSAWRQQGIDSGLFAEEFLNHCRILIEDPVGGSTGSSTPVDGSLISSPISLRNTAKLALSQTKSLGSSTFLLGHLQSDKLQICNLGDCCLIHIRFLDNEPEILLKTDPQQHSFNTPYQICHENTNSNRGYIKDSPDVALQYELKVISGDIIIAATDGMWDNLFLDEILALVKLHKTHIRKLAKSIIDLAYEHSISSTKTPFEVAVKETYGPNQWHGGKPDDITVLCAFIQHKL